MRALATIQLVEIPQHSDNSGDCALEFINADGSAVILTSHWDLPSFNASSIIENCQKVRFTLPSGVFIGDLKSMSNVSRTTDLTVTLQGQWSGKQAGLIAGMSSLGWFQAQNIVVLEGTYVLPEEAEGLPYSLYKERCNKHRLLHGDKAIRAEHTLYTDDPEIDKVWENWRSSLRRTLKTPMSVFAAKQAIRDAQKRIDNFHKQPMFSSIALIEGMVMMTGIEAWSRHKVFTDEAWTGAVLTALVHGTIEEFPMSKEEYRILDTAAQEGFNWLSENQIDLWKGTGWDLPVPCDDSPYLGDEEE